MRPIDADAALKALRKCQTYLYDARDPELKIELSSAEAAINNLPTIQPQSTTGQLNDGAQSTARSTDLIDRQAAIDALAEALKQIGVLDIEDVGLVLSALPPAQPDPHEGHWINGKCDLCGEHAPFWAMASTYHESKYCPNCGAKMTTSK